MAKVTTILTPFLMKMAYLITVNIVINFDTSNQKLLFRSCRNDHGRFHTLMW